MVTIILEVGRFGVGVEVRKVNGGKTYTIRKEILIYGSSLPPIKASEGTVFLYSESGINAVSSDTKMAKDFDNIKEAVMFLENLEEGNG